MQQALSLSHDIHLLVAKDKPSPPPLLLSHDMYLLVAKDKPSPPLLQVATALQQSSGIVLSSF